MAAVVAATACAGPGRSTGGEAAGRSAGQRRAASPSATDACPPSNQRVEVAVGNTTRTAIVTVPGRAAAPLPAVVLVHGFAARAAEFLETSEIADMADAAGVVVIAPQGLGDPPGWDVLTGFGADDAFVTELLDRLTTSGCVDPGRVAMGGHSAGSAFAAFYGCAHPDRFSGLVLNAGLPPPLCGEGTPNLVITHGTADPVVPFDGGDQAVGAATIELGSIPESAAAWAAQAGCGAPTEPDGRRDGTVRWTRWSGCTGGTSVSLAAIDGWGHAWPTADSSAGLDDGCLLIAAAVGVASPAREVEACG